jgi:hypothetical protein
MPQKQRSLCTTTLNNATNVPPAGADCGVMNPLDFQARVLKRKRSQKEKVVRLDLLDKRSEPAPKQAGFSRLRRSKETFSDLRNQLKDLRSCGKLQDLETRPNVKVSGRACCPYNHDPGSGPILRRDRQA